MSVTLCLAAFSLLLALASARMFRHLSHILVAYYLLWAGIFLVAAWNPLRLQPVSSNAGWILAVGLAAAFAGAALVSVSRGKQTAAQRSVIFPASRPRWIVGLTLASVGLMVAVIAFRDAVSAAAGDIAFSTLSPTEVRYLSVYGSAVHAGIGTVLFSLAPFVAAGGVIVGRRQRLGYVFTLFALVMSAQSLSRNQVFYTALAALLCWVYYRPGGDASGRKGRRRLLQAGAAIVVLAGLLGYFQYTGSLLNKSAPTQLLVGTTIPEPLVEPTLYITGSPEALSVAIEDDLQPTYGEQGRSVWIVPRLVSLVDPNASVPDTVAAPVPIPYSFNTYTWVGDLWFDFGWAGIVVGGLFLGAVTVIIDRRARRIGSPLSSWFAAAWGTTLLASVIAFEVFWLQTVVWLFAGLLIFGSWPTRSYGRGRDHLRTPPPPLPRPPG